MSASTPPRGKKQIRGFFVALAAILICAFAPDRSFAECDPGYIECPNVPGKCGLIGTICHSDGHSSPIGDVYCGGGKSCHSGYVCANDGLGCMKAGNVYCGNGKSCPGGTICGNGECIAKDSPRVCSNGAYCEEGRYCGSDGKCHRVQSQQQKPSATGSGNQGSGVSDASFCIDVVSTGDASYNINNTCTFAVKIKLQTKNFSPQDLFVDTYRIAPNSSEQVISYHGFAPNVLSASGQ